MLSNAAIRMSQLFPQWMRAYSNPEDSNNIKFLDAFGKRIDDFEALVMYIMKAPYLNIDSEDFSFYTIDYIYKLSLHPDQIGKEISSLKFAYTDNSLNGIILDSENMVQASTIYQFYTEKLADGSPNLNIYYYDRSLNTIYMRRKYDYIIANGAKFRDIESQHVWGVYDEIGLLLACPRISGEHNAEYVTRLFSVFTHPGNATEIGLKNYISRSLGIEVDEVLLNDFNDSYIFENMQDGISKDLSEFIDLSNKLNLSDENSYWEIIEDNSKGLQYLPIPWKNIIYSIPDEYIQNGVAGVGDLEIIEPELEEPIYPFECTIEAMVPIEEPREISPILEIEYTAITDCVIEDEQGDLYSTDYKYRIVAGKLTELDFQVALEQEYKQVIEYELVDNVTLNTIAKADIDGEIYSSEVETINNIISEEISIIEESSPRYSIEASSSNKWDGAQIKQLKTTNGYLSLI